MLNNYDKDLYPEETLSTDPHQKFMETGSFLNYFLCGYKAILALDSSHKEKMKNPPTGLRIYLDSLVPPAAGLSSSSAFCVCAAVLTAHANGLIKEIDQKTLAELTIKAERMAGTACGGMDQTISVMGQRNTAKLIDFKPSLKATDIKMPSSVSFVIANSLSESPKLMTLGKNYNKRVVECRFALSILSMKLGKSTSFVDCPYKDFDDLQKDLGHTFEQMIRHCEYYLQPGGYTIQMLQQHTENPFKLVEDVSHINEVESQNTHFYLFERAKHVFGEASRVHQFRAICESTELEEDTKVTKLGNLMNESHKSCHELYDCSSPQLEELTGMARKAGALGSRLTGAGWGGCCVSMVPKKDIKTFIDQVMDYYTKEREPEDRLWITDDLERYIFGTQAGNGALVLNPEFCLWFD